LSNSTTILFAAQYKNDNTAFHRRSAVSGGLALLRAFCQWKIEHQVRKCCVKGLILRIGTWLDAREMQAVCLKVFTSSSAASTQNFWGQILRLQLEASILFGTLPVKAQNDKICYEFFRGHGPFGPPVYAYGYKKRMKYKDQYLMFNLPLTISS